MKLQVDKDIQDAYLADLQRKKEHDAGSPNRKELYEIFKDIENRLTKLEAGLKQLQRKTTRGLKIAGDRFTRLNGRIDDNK